MNIRRYRQATLALLKKQWDAMPKERVTCPRCAASDLVTADKVDGYMCGPCKGRPSEDARECLTCATKYPAPRPTVNLIYKQEAGK